MTWGTDSLFLTAANSQSQIEERGYKKGGLNNGCRTRDVTV